MVAVHPVIVSDSAGMLTGNLKLHLYKSSYRQASLRQTLGDPQILVRVIRSSSYQDIVIHVQYYSQPNRAWKRVCIQQEFVFFLTRFYCINCVHTDISS